MSHDPRAFFAAHGWLVVRAAVPPSRVRELEAAVERDRPTAGAHERCRAAARAM